MSRQLDGMPEPHPAPASDREADKFVDTVMYCLTAPRIGYGRGKPDWPEALEHNKDQITLQRLAHAQEIQEQEMCTEFEAMLYLSTASLEAPLHSDAYHVYMHLFRRWNPEAAEQIQSEWERSRPLNAQEQELLSRLRRDIYRDQMKHLKAKLRGESVEDLDDEAAQAGNRAERRRQEREARKAGKGVNATQPQLF